MTTGAKKSTAGRRASAGQQVKITVCGEDFTLPEKMDFLAAVNLADGINNPSLIKVGIDDLLGEDADRLWKARPSIDDVAELVRQVMEGYGATPGESSASTDSSKNGGS